MPYDKGDFTQQGIDGKVAGGLLLNNKRDVDVIVSSNEDDSTLGSVTVTIEDHLNDLKYAFEGENLEAGEVYEIGAGGGGDSPIVYIKVNITNVDANIDLYDYDSSNRNAALTNYFTDEDSGSVRPYFKTTNSMVNNPDGTGSLIASKNGGTGEIYLIPKLISVYKNGGWVPSKAFQIDNTRATALTEVSNVTITEDEYFYTFKLTDPNTSGEINISLLGYIPD